MSEQLLTMGVVIGFVPEHADLVYVSNGFFVVSAYIPSDRSQIQIGATYNLYKQNSIYMLGVQLQGQ